MNSPFLRYTAKMSLDVGGYENRPDWPKLGPSFLIATCLIVAIRTAKWAAHVRCADQWERARAGDRLRGACRRPSASASHVRKRGHVSAEEGAVVPAGRRGSSEMRRTLISRQFFFAVGKPHRPMDAKLTGEDAGRFRL